MDVLGASDKLAICAWTEGERVCEEIFPITKLSKVELQQPEPTVGPGPQF